MRRGALATVAVGLMALFALLIIQFYTLQVVDHPKWLRRAQLQHEAVVREPAKRGTFYPNPSSGFHAPLAIDLPLFHLHADPDVIPTVLKGEIAARLGFPDAASQLQRKSRNRQLKRWLTQEEREAILVWWLPYARQHKIARNALFFLPDYKRSHPYGHLAGQLLHTIRERKEEGTGAGIPTGGLEATFDSRLRGKGGLRWVLRSPRRPLAVGGVIEQAEEGESITLTIHPLLQAIAEEEIEKAVTAAEAKGGWAILMDPYNGEILAFAQYPFFNPADYRDYFNDPDKIEETVVHGVSHAFEPGSTMKPLTLALALKANEELRAQGKKPLFDPAEKIPCRDGHFPGRSKPIHDTTVSSYLNMEMALQKSSNIYVGRLACRICDRLGADWYRRQLEETLGFGQKTGIELPGQTRGFLPTPGLTYTGGAPQWATSTPPSLAMGYNLLVSSIQTVRAFAIIANGGVLLEPTLIKGRVGERRQVLSQEICDQVIRAMKYSTKPGGTAWRGDIMGYTQVGKTGTSEKIVSGTYSKTLHFTNFAGFAPANHAAFVCFVAIDEPRPYTLPGIGSNHFGGRWATRTFREIAKRSLVALGIPPDDPCGYPKGDPRHDPDKADWTKEVAALQTLYEAWNGS
ncbi:MAG: peptidoglycan D,D-transpeptidase FtsI family protein [Parachlamydiales bacterium]